MKIYTKTGDGGQTALFGGARIPKYHPRIESYGTVDELNAFTGLLADSINDGELRAELRHIQSTLFTLGSHLAAEPGKKNLWVPELHEEEIGLLEKRIDAWDLELPPLKNFILPGGHTQVSHAHVCRTVCRRAERLCIALQAEEGNVPEKVIPYLNRLSDYFFTLARKLAHDLGVEEIAWQPRKKDEKG
jgi:cob(I)alamin adenosyltransferase